MAFRLKIENRANAFILFLLEGWWERCDIRARSEKTNLIRLLLAHLLLGILSGTVHGDGVYFAKNFSYSANKIYSPEDPLTGLRHIFQCRVLIGIYTTGSSGLKEAPVKPGTTAERFDSVVDKTPNPSIYVIFKDDQAFPEYLISFR